MQFLFNNSLQFYIDCLIPNIKICGIFLFKEDKINYTKFYQFVILLFISKKENRNSFRSNGF